MMRAAGSWELSLQSGSGVNGVAAVKLVVWSQHEDGSTEGVHREVSTRTASALLASSLEGCRCIATEGCPQTTHGLHSIVMIPH
jgi:hypothetical protein